MFTPSYFAYTQNSSHHEHVHKFINSPNTVSVSMCPKTHKEQKVVSKEMGGIWENTEYAHAYIHMYTHIFIHMHTYKL